MPKTCSTRGATRVRAPRSGTGKRKAGRTIIPDDNITRYTEIARQFVLEAWPEIVKGLVQKAAEGGYQQAKLLLDISDLNSEDASRLHQQRNQLCDALLEGLGLGEEIQETRKVETKADLDPCTRSRSNCGSASVRHASNSVSKVERD